MPLARKTAAAVENTVETISSDLLNDIEAFLIARIDVNIDGLPNRAMILLHLLQAERTNPAATEVDVK